MDETWLCFIDALVNGREPNYPTLGTTDGFAVSGSHRVLKRCGKR